jgi:hypothetical protein
LSDEKNYEHVVLDYYLGRYYEVHGKTDEARY